MNTNAGMMQMPHALQRRGLDVFVVDGWGSRGAGRMGMARVYGTICHWIVSTLRGSKSNRQTLGLIVNGHSTLAGPLANLYLGWDGAVGVVAAGRANHGGVGSWRGISGNQYWVGVEAEGPPFTPEQLEAYPKILAAVYDVFGQHPREWGISHQMYAPSRKIDIGPQINQIRERAIYLVDNKIFTGNTNTTPKPSEETEMMSRFMRASNSPDVYLVQGHNRIHVPNEDRLKDLKTLNREAPFLNGGNDEVRVVSPAVLDMFVDVTPKK